MSRAFFYKRSMKPFLLEIPLSDIIFPYTKGSFDAMKKIAFTLTILFITTGFVQAQDSYPSDFVVLCDIFLKGIREIITPHFPFSEKTLQIIHPLGIGLSSKTKETAEALFTDEGFSIARESQNTDYRFSIAVSEVRIILHRKNKRFNRSVLMNIHIKCVNADHKVIFASGHKETYCDIIPGDLLRSTDDCKQFSKDIQRILIKKNHDRLRLLSLVAIMGALIFFSFE